MYKYRSTILTDYSISTRITTITKKYIISTWQRNKLTVQLIRLTRSFKLIWIHLWLSQISTDIFWYTSENIMEIFQQKKGSACSLTNINDYWNYYRRRKRNTQHGTDAHKVYNKDISGEQITVILLVEDHTFRIKLCGLNNS